MSQLIDTHQPETAAFALPNDIVRVDRTNLATLNGLSPWLRMVFRMLTKIRWGSLVVLLPDGRAFRFEGTTPGAEGVLVVDSFKFAMRIARNGGIGFAEGYMAREWNSPDLTDLLLVFANNIDEIEQDLQGNFVVRFVQRMLHFFRRNTKRGSKRNIHAHYDLGNEFYKQWLDKTMTYSSAKFDRRDVPLSEAQLNKYRSLAESAGITKNSSVLEIGCGWGGFAEFAAREIGCKVTGITISKEQLAFAQKRIADAGLSDRVTLRFQDYRDVDETFDAVVSIEMFEAVGESYWPAYFSKIRDALKPGGRAALQIITIKDEYFASYRLKPDFIQRYIFPGGMLPSPAALLDQVKEAGLKWVDNVNFGLDYAATLSEWRERFLASWSQIKPLGFDDRFKRLWHYYLSYCEAGFRARSIDVTQIVLTK